MRKQAIQEITEYIEIFYSRQRKQVALATCHPLHSRSDIMQIDSLLDSLDSTIANRPRC